MLLVTLLRRERYIARVVALRLAERDRAEKTRRAGEARLEAIVETTADGVVLADGRGRIIGWNRAATTMFGYTEAEALALEVTDLMPERFRAAHRAGMARVASRHSPLAGRTVAMTGRRRDGAEFPIELTAGTWQDGEQRFFSGILRDVSERHAAAERLRAERDRSGALIRSVRDGLAMVDSSGALLEANDRFLELVGRPAHEVIGRRPPYPWWPTEDAARLLEGYRAAVRGEPMEIDARMVRPDGTAVPVLIAAAPVRGHRGGRGVVVSVKDMTERNEIERMKDEFVALASHELRSPLTSVLGYLELALEGEAGPLSPALESYLRVAERNGRTLQRLSGDLLTVARADAGRLSLDLHVVDLAELAAECVEDHRSRAEEQRIALELAGAPVPDLRADGARLRQVPTNLVSNALKFTPPGGRVRLTTVVTGDMAVIEVSDTGIGIPPAEQERLFERFYRTRSAAARQIPGTGLGLAISLLIVQGHGGTIGVRSAEGTGTTFRVELPLAPAATPVSASR